MLAEHTVDGGAGDAVALCQLAQALATLAVPQDGSAIEIERLATDMAAFEAGAAHAGAHPFDNKVALQLGDGSDDDHYGAAQWPAGIDLLPKADELDVEPVQLVQHF